MVCIQKSTVTFLVLPILIDVLPSLMVGKTHHFNFLLDAVLVLMRDEVSKVDRQRWKPYRDQVNPLYDANRNAGLSKLSEGPVIKSQR